MRLTRNFALPFKLIPSVSSPHAENIPLLDPLETAIERTRPASHEGRIAIVTDVERGMRWTRTAF